MDEWDLDPSPQPKPRRPEARVDEVSTATPGPATGPGRGASESTPAVAPEHGASGSKNSQAGGGASRGSRRRRRIITAATWAMVGAVLLLVGVAIGFGVARTQADDATAELSSTRDQLGVVERALSQAEERNWNYYRENLALKEQIEAGAGGGATSTSTTASGQSGRTTYGDGIYLVGEEIPPGTYDGVVIGEQGYWARLKATDGLVSSIVANAVPRGPFVLTVVVSDRAVELRGVEITAQ